MVTPALGIGIVDHTIYYRRPQLAERYIILSVEVSTPQTNSAYRCNPMLGANLGYCPFFSLSLRSRIMYEILLL